MSGLALVFCAILVAVLKTPAETRELPPLVIRIDDIQDRAFRDATFFLLNENASYRALASLAVIPGRFGDDKEIVAAVKAALGSGSEVTSHGLLHEDLTTFSRAEQVNLLTQARARIKEILGRNTKILVPPSFNFNDNTISAMQATGYTIISSATGFTEPGLLSTVVSVPGTVNLSVLSNNTTWEMKSNEAVMGEISGSVQKYGFAVVVTHPQEFLKNGILNEADTKSYSALLDSLKQSYTFTTLEKLGAKLKKQYSSP